MSPEAIERLTTNLLRDYPEAYEFHIIRFPAKQAVTSSFADFRPPLYVYRAEAQAALGNFRGAEADLTTALRLGERLTPFLEPDWIKNYTYGSQAFLRIAYLQRAELRFDHLQNPAGGCADLARSYQLDTVRASAPRWRGCPLPAARVPAGAGQLQLAQAAYLDSLHLAERLMRAGRPTAVERLLRPLASGQVGAYVRVRPPHPEDARQVSALLSDAARARGHYARARAYLDTLLALPDPRPADRYRLGTLKIDYLGDPAGGCQDLRWVYDHDTTRTAPTHPRWRACQLQRYKNPVGPLEIQEYYRAYQDSMDLVHKLSSTPALRLLSGLLNTRAAGRYAPFPVDTAAVARQLPQPGYSQMWANTRQYRAGIYAHLEDYARARADLDTLLQGAADSQEIRAIYRQRADYRLNYLHDTRGGRADLKKALGPKPHYYLEDHFVIKAGLLVQGQTVGLEATLRPGQGEAGTNGGGAFGLEVLAAPLILGPKVGLEGAKGPVGGRIEVVGYVPLTGPNRHVDFRVIPQAGLSVGGLLNLYYGYALPLTDTTLPAIGRHRVSLSINFLDLPKWGG